MGISRLQAALVRLKDSDLGGLVLFSSANISYLTGFNSSDAFYLISPKGSIYFTDSRYSAAARKAMGNSAAIEDLGRNSPFSAIAGYVQKFKIRRLGFEEKGLSFLAYRKLRKSLKSATALVCASGILEEIRQVKSASEITRIRSAVDITVAALRYIKGRIKAGRTELEIAGDLERFIRYNGASSSAFETIVASGPNSAFPHHHTGMRKVKRGEPVMIDIGVVYQGYKSDLTRIFFSDKINSLAIKAYNIVLEAQKQAIGKIREGVGANEVDALCRSYISKSDLRKDAYKHGTGHGIGLDVHEPPSISNSSQTKLKAGMVVTIEPAVYLNGRFGIRLEDVVLVTKTGSEVLSGTLHK